MCNQADLVMSVSQMVSVEQETNACRISDASHRVCSHALEEHAVQMCKQ